MADFILDYYLWVKALHVIAIIAWMAGLLYLPRLYVYHVNAKEGSDLSETLKLMEYRLLKFIMNPAMIVSWLLGGLMLWANTGLFSSGWMHLKLTAIILLSALHMVFGKWRKNFANDNNTKSEKFYRLWNEGPTVLMIIIVLMAVAMPF